jgi:sodium-independent sulfate anion transporter 11
MNNIDDIFFQSLGSVSWFSSSSSSSSPTACQLFWQSRLGPGARKAASTCLWLAFTARNAVVILVCVLVVHLIEPGLDASDAFALRNTTFRLTGSIVAGLPEASWPPFSTVVDGETVGLGQMVYALGSGVFVLPLVSVLENVAIAKAFGK